VDFLAAAYATTLIASLGAIVVTHVWIGSPREQIELNRRLRETVSRSQKNCQKALEALAEFETCQDGVELQRQMELEESVRTLRGEVAALQLNLDRLAEDCGNMRVVELRKRLVALSVIEGETALVLDAVSLMEDQGDLQKPLAECLHLEVQGGRRVQASRAKLRSPVLVYCRDVQRPDG
jgi:capsule polysaccharide export protein KpsE/RkpR